MALLGRSLTIAPRHILHPVRSRAIETAGDAIEHVTDVADKGIGDRWSLNPSALGLHL